MFYYRSVISDCKTYSEVYLINCELSVFFFDQHYCCVMALKETFNAGMLVLVGVFDTYSITETGTCGNHVQSKRKKNLLYLSLNIFNSIQGHYGTLYCRLPEPFLLVQ